MLRQDTAGESLEAECPAVGMARRPEWLEQRERGGAGWWFGARSHGQGSDFSVEQKKDRTDLGFKSIPLPDMVAHAYNSGILGG